VEKGQEDRKGIFLSDEELQEFIALRRELEQLALTVGLRFLDLNYTTFLQYARLQKRQKKLEKALQQKYGIDLSEAEYSISPRGEIRKVERGGPVQ